MMTSEGISRNDPWSQVLEMVRQTVPTYTYQSWFEPLKILSMAGGRMVLGTDDQFAIKTLRQRYAGMLSNAVSRAYGREYELVFVNLNDPQDEAQQLSMGVQGMLNEKYTFDTFVVGNSNRFAHAASLAVAELPSDAYNPLFLYGGVGLGKTHLMHAIGHYIANENPEAKILYITSELFTNEVISAISNKTNQQMRERFRNVDVLMVDDIQFIAGKTATQEEFFHTFNQLHSGGKQIVISSDRPPKDIPTLEERLRSRFEWGLIADIQKPDYETRIAILRKKAELEHIQVSDEVLNFIADKVQSNIRELEGALTRVNAKSMLSSGEPITLEMADEALSNILGSRDARRITAELIIDVVADYYRVDRADILSQRRNREIAVPRQVAMYLTREMTSLSTTRIGDSFGGRDHTTVMHGCEKISAAARSTSQMAKTIEELKRRIQEK